MPNHPLELWGGVECTVNRVGDRFFDQMERNGHSWREDDLERFAALGLRALRYPILWERFAPEQAAVTDWSWADRRLHHLRELGIRPIVGLVHHGSGPRRTHLLDPGFAGGLADFARQVAERYPWIEDYTPVNEPLTTARFSALYGHWYPHTHDIRSFARAFLNQCQAVVLSMRAIRAVNPAARLVQTEDLGKTFSTPELADLAEFENQRRWLTFDLLGGHLDEKHPMWAFLRDAGIPIHELTGFLQRPCPPDLLGINHYITSERFLDERRQRYPAYSHVSHEGLDYADMPAVRATAQGVSGPGRLLREAWERYHLPLAITEAQLNCSREEQMRWFAEIWRDASALRAQEGVDVRAVTAWALLGAFNWTNLLTRDDPGSYEPGAFDVRTTPPRPTALAALARTLARDGDSDHPVLGVPGWWHRPGRLVGLPAEAHQPLTPAVGGQEKRGVPSAPLLIAGEAGAFASAFAAICGERALSSQFLGGDLMDPSSPGSVRQALDHLKPWAVIQLPAASEVVAGRDASTPHLLALACAERGIPWLGFSVSRGWEEPAPATHAEGASSDLTGVGEEDATRAEAQIFSVCPSALVVRTGVPFGPWEDGDPVLATVRNLLAGGKGMLPADGDFSLTYLPDLVQTCLDLLLDGERGVWHLSSGGSLDLARFTACLQLITGSGAPDREPPPARTPDEPADLPLRSTSACGQSFPLPSWQSALKHLVDTRLSPPDN